MDFPQLNTIFAVVAGLPSVSWLKCSHFIADLFDHFSTCACHTRYSGRIGLLNVQIVVRENDFIE